MGRENNTGRTSQSSPSLRRRSSSDEARPAPRPQLAQARPNQAPNQTRHRRSNAIGNAQMFEEQTGYKPKDLLPPRSLVDQRMHYAAKAMNFTRDAVGEPANVMRSSPQDERNRASEHETMKANRREASFAKNGHQSILSSTQEQMHGDKPLHHSYSQFGALAEMTRAASCMEMAAVSLDYLGGKAQKYQDRLAQPNLPEFLRTKYQLKLDALSNVSLQYGNNVSDENHMWVRMGQDQQDSTVVSDAWARGGPVRQQDSSSREIFAYKRGQIDFSPQDLSHHHYNVNVVKSSPAVREGIEWNAQIASRNRRRSSFIAPAQAQHHNRKDSE